MGLRDASDLIRALTDSAGAIHSFRSTTKEQAKANTIRSLMAEVGRLRQQVISLEDSFKGVSTFATKVIEQFGVLEQKIENAYRERLAGRTGDGGGR